VRFDIATGSITFPDGTTAQATGTFEWAVVASPATPDLIRKDALAQAAKARAKTEEIRAALAAMIITISTAEGRSKDGPVFRARLEPTNAVVIIDANDEIVDYDLTGTASFPWAATGHALKDGIRQIAASKIAKLEKAAASAQESADATLDGDDHRLLWGVVRWMNSKRSATKLHATLNREGAIGRTFSIVAAE